MNSHWNYLVCEKKYHYIAQNTILFCWTEWQNKWDFALIIPGKLNILINCVRSKSNRKYLAREKNVLHIARKIFWSGLCRGNRASKMRVIFFFIFWKSRSCLLSTEAFISALNLHAIGNKHGNLFYEHFVLWPVAPFFNHYSQINVFSASNDFLPQHRPLKSRLRNQNHWIICSVTIQYFLQWF